MTASSPRVTGRKRAFDDDLGEIVGGVPLFSRRREFVREELRTHLEEEVDDLRGEGFAPAAAADEARRRFGPPSVLADAFRALEARRPFWVDPVCLRSLLAVLASYAILSAAILGGVLLIGLYDGREETVDIAEGLGHSLRLVFAGLSGIFAYHASLARRGNPYRLAPYVGLSALLLAASWGVRCDVRVDAPLPVGRWEAVLRFPGLSSNPPSPSVRREAALFLAADRSGWWGGVPDSEKIERSGLRPPDPGPLGLLILVTLATWVTIGRVSLRRRLGLLPSG